MGLYFLLIRVTDYAWAFVFRWKKNRKLKKTNTKWLWRFNRILKNNTKVKVFRRKNRFFETNKMLWTMQDIVTIYKLRWAIEKVFKILKHCVGINRCQQHSIALQEVFIRMSLVAFSYLERIKDHSIYKARYTVNFQTLCLDESIWNEILTGC